MHIEEVIPDDESARFAGDFDISKPVHSVRIHEHMFDCANRNFSEKFLDLLLFQAVSRMVFFSPVWDPGCRLCGAGDGFRGPQNKESSRFLL